MDKIFNINLNGETYELQDRPLTEQVATLQGEVAGKLDATAYTKYDDTQVKADIQANTTAIAGKQDKGNYAISGTSYTKAESDAKYLTEHQSLTAYAKVADVNTELDKKQDKGDYVSATTLNDYAKKADIPNTSEFITSAYTYDKATIDSSLDNKADKSDVYTKTEVDSKISEKLDVTAYTPTDMSNYYTKTESDNKLTDKQDALVSGTNVKTINGESILGEGNITIENDTDLSDYYTKTEIDNMVGNINNALNQI